MNPLADTQIAFVGAGTMAEAFIRGLLAKDLVPAKALTASDPLETRRDYLTRELGIATKASNAEAAAGADIIVFAVKPQVLDKVLDSLKGRVARGTLVLSIVAGAPIAPIRQALNVASVVRIMPNTPGQIGEGISVWTATPETAEAQREQAGAIVGASVIVFLRQITRFIPGDVPFGDQLAYIRLMVVGAVLILVLYYRPEGLLGDAERLQAGTSE